MPDVGAVNVNFTKKQIECNRKLYMETTKKIHSAVTFKIKQTCPKQITFSLTMTINGHNEQEPDQKSTS